MIREVVSTVSTRVLSVGCLVAANVLAARTMGPAGQGVFATVSTFATVIAQFGNLGLHSSNTYLVLHDPERLDALTANSVWISLLSGLFGVLVAAASLSLLPAHELGGWLVWLGVLSVPLRMFVLLGGNLLIGRRRVSTYNALQLVLYIGLLAGTLAVILGSEGPAAFLVMHLIVWTAAAAYTLWQLAPAPPALRTFHMEIFHKGLGYSLRTYAICLFAFLVLRGNLLLLQAFMNDEAVGQYSVAAQFVEIINIVPHTTALVLFPKLIGKGAVPWAQTRRVAGYMAVLLGAACIVSGLLIEPAVVFLFGSRFVGAAAILRWMLPGAWCYGMTSIVSQYFAVRGQPLALVGIWGVSLAGMLALSLFLIPRHGTIGAAAALSAAYAVSFVCQLILVRWVPDRPGMFAGLDAPDASPATRAA